MSPENLLCLIFWQVYLLLQKGECLYRDYLIFDFFQRMQLIFVVVVRSLQRIKFFRIIFSIFFTYSVFSLNILHHYLGLEHVLMSS